MSGLPPFNTMTEKTLLEDAISAERCVLTVMGNHAGEGVAAIFQRKEADLQEVKVTFWLVKSPKATPALVQGLCADGPAHVLFIAPAATRGARPTKGNARAAEYSADGITWHALPAGLGPVTGHLDSRAYALVFDELATVEDGTADLWSYADFAEADRPIKIMLGCSTVCAVRRKVIDHSEGLKSRFRKIVAVARLTAPFCVFVR